VAEVWAVSTNKGGVLKTSITTNLAGLLSGEGKVLIIDCDNQGNSSLSFGKNPDNFEYTLYDVLINNKPAKDAIYNVYENIDILPANDEMTFFDFDVLQNRDKYQQPFRLLKNAVDSLRSDYDYILIDAPPNVGIVVGNIFTFTDKVIIPFQPESYSQRSLIKILEVIKSFKENHNPSLSILGVVCTLVDSRTSLHSEMITMLRRLCIEQDITCFDTVIPRSVRFASAVAYKGLPATLTDSKQPLVAAYVDLLDEIKGNMEGESND